MFWYLAWPGEDAGGITLHALGGQSIYDREKFLALDGFDTLFSPFYHEDLDVSWRAYRQGWRVIYEPRAVMVHRGATTAGRLYSREQLDAFMQKNLLLFMWKNLRGKGMLPKNLLWLAPRVAAALLKRDRAYLRGLAGALPRAGAALRAGSASRSSAKLSDEEILALFENE
jgi:GT2 family glycosyltransferase